MRLSTGSRITINGINGTVVVTDINGNPLMARYDINDKPFTITNQIILPIITK